MGCRSQTVNQPAQTAPVIQTSAPTAYTTSEAKTTAPITQTATSGSQTKTSASEPLKIGAIMNLEQPLGFDLNRCIKVLANLYNKNGGLTIGGIQYQIELIIYDNNGNQSATAAAANRLISEDQVKFIVCDPTGTDAIWPISEPAKVLLSAQAISPALFNPANKYSFNTGGLINTGNILAGWVADNYPGKTLVMALPDNQIGHMIAGLTGMTMSAFGLKETNMFYPPMAQDLSSLGTKVATLNPDMYLFTGSGNDALAYKAVYQAGYRGIYFGFTQLPVATLEQQVPPTYLEGFIGGALPTEFDHPTTQNAQDFMNAYIAMNGKWDNPDVTGLPPFCALIAALQKANSLDVAKVAQVMGDALVYECPSGTFQTVSRTDMGNSRCVDSILGFPMKKITGGKPAVTGTISVDQAFKYFQKVYPPKGIEQSSGTPTIVVSTPPGGGLVEISWDKASDYMDKDVVVSITAQVADVITFAPPDAIVFIGGGMGTGLGLDVKNPSSFPGDITKDWKGKTITVTGKVTKNPMFGSPEMVITEASQITVK